jgi:hypothetical protein
MGTSQYSRVLFSALTKLSFCSLLVGAATASLAAPPEITMLFPAGAAPGETQAVTAAGTFATWPPQVWTSDSRLTVECEKDKGKLKVVVAADAAPGIAWLRLIDGEGASAPRPFVIARDPSVLEKEPNDAAKQAQQLAGNSVVHGKYNKGGDADTYAISLTAGQTLVAWVQANQLFNSPADPAVQICADTGEVLAMNQDASGLDSLLSFTAKRDGVYLVRTFALPAMPNSTINYAGGDNFLYRLTITTGSYADATLPLSVTKGTPPSVQLHGWNVPAEPVAVGERGAIAAEPWFWSPPTGAGLISLKEVAMPSLVAGEAARTKEGQAVETPCCLSGVVAQRGEVHRFTFAGKKGAKLAFVVEAESLGYDLDPFLKVIGPEDKAVGEVDDTGKERDGTLTVTLPVDGSYVFELRDLHRSGSSRHVYRVTIDAPQPKVSLSAAAGSHLIEAGKTLEIPVTINRQNGFGDEFKIEAIELPAGVTAEVATSAAKGDTAKQSKLNLTAAADAKAGPFRIVARGADGGELAVATYAQTLGTLNFQHPGLWLAVKEAKPAEGADKPAEDKKP